MKFALPLTFIPGLTFAHGVHVEPVSGHSHWMVPAAVIAAAFAIVLARKLMANRTR